MPTISPVRPCDPAQLRHAIYDKGAANRTDLAGLIVLGRDFGDDPDFIALIADVARDALSLDADPRGYVSDDDADWLTAHLGEGSGLGSRAEFEVLKSVISHSVSVPPALVAFALREVERGILTGKRAAHGGADDAPALVTAEDVEALRAVAFAPTAGRPCHVDRAAAEALFDIAHATATAPNDPAFAPFFAQAVGNYLIGAVFLEAPSRDAELAHERELDRKQSFSDFLGRLAAGPGHVAEALKSVDRLADDRYHEENAETEARLEAAARIDAGEAKWVLAHLARGELSPAEMALLAFLREEAAETAPDLAALIGRAA